MCGIAGIVRFTGLAAEEREYGAAMAGTLRHRGPDECGAYCDGIASLGHARLSIIDLGSGRQPMSNENGTIWVTFNGEIYNHLQLADMLRGRGHVLRTRCDTEVIPHLYEEFGDDFVAHLNGMFAIALWDASRRRLVLVRDRLGLKPLYWHDNGRRILFGSELKALLASGEIETRVDPLAVTDYLTFGHVPAPRTVLDGVRKLEPATLAVCTAKGASCRRYWDIPLTDHEQETGARGDDEWVSQFAALLQDAIAIRMIADVPVGAFLSGGVDSATITAGMTRTAGKVLTHTVGFEEQDHDERFAARKVADLLGTDHYEVLVRPDAASAAELLARHFDEPFADSSAVPTFYLSQAARQRVKVALAGDGGDELLGGYRRYRFDLAESAWRARLPGWLRSTLAISGHLYPKADWLPRPLRAKVTLQNLGCDDVSAHLRSVSLFQGTLPALLLRPEWLTAGYDPHDRRRALVAQTPNAPLLSRLLHLDMKTLLADDMLTKVDRASMAVGLEVREPLLDYRLVELAARAPARLRLGKQLLRRTLGRWTNQEIASRPKQGFNVPVDSWFRGSLRDMAGDLLLASNAHVNEWIDARAIRRAVRDHQQGLRHNGHLLWTLLSLELWARAYRVKQEDRARDQLNGMSAHAVNAPAGRAQDVTLEPVEV